MAGPLRHALRVFIGTLYVGGWRGSVGGEPDSTMFEQSGVLTTNDASDQF